MGAELFHITTCRHWTCFTPWVFSSHPGTRTRASHLWKWCAGKKNQNCSPLTNEEIKFWVMRDINICFCRLFLAAMHFNENMAHEQVSCGNAFLFTKSKQSCSTENPVRTKTTYGKFFDWGSKGACDILDHFCGHWSWIFLCCYCPELDLKKKMFTIHCFTI